MTPASSTPAPAPPAGPLELTILMPCLDEAETLERCIGKAQQFLAQHQVAGEVLIADNGSRDGSPEMAERLGARVVRVPVKGYGGALLGGIAAARGKYIVMGDADDSYNFSEIAPFLDRLREGFDLVMGNRFRGGIAPGAMPPLHRFLGNPVLTGLGRLFFHCPVGDFHCGLRGFNRASIQGLHLRTTGMEFASEMVAKASLMGLRVTEVPTALAKDGRSRPPHLRTWRDGWRHLRFMLLYSPSWLFLYPGLGLMAAGAAVGLWLLPGPRPLGRAVLDIHTLLYASLAVLIGFQAVLFAVFTRIFAVTEGLLPPDPHLNRWFKFITLETGLVAGGLLVMLGLGGSLSAVWHWSGREYGPLDPSQTLRTVIPSGLALALGAQVMLSSFFLSVLGLRRSGAPDA